MTSVYRERDRYDDARSTASTRRGDDDSRTYTKVTRYVIREDDDTRSSHTSRRRESPERETIRITRREVDDRESVASHRRSAPTTYVEKDVSVRGREEENRSPRPWERYEDVTNKEIVIRRSEEHDDGPRRETDRESVAVTKIDDRRDNQRHGYDVYRSADHGRDRDRDRDLQHYTRTAEYYAPAAQPQTIIIRQDPIIIRERVRDDDYQVVKKSDIGEEKSVVSTRRGEERDEEFSYEKKVRERYDDDYYDHDRKSRRELSPGDSISQAGRRRREDSYSSDDSMVYVKRVERDDYSRGSSPDKKKDLAAGVIAGVGAAELLRNHRKKEGRETSHGIGRVGRDVGAGAIGAIAAEGIRRYRSKSRHGSRDRSRSSSYGRYGHHRDHRGRSRSRSGSRPNLKTLGALGLGAVAVAAAASLATRKMDANKKATKEHRRSRSRRRRSSRSSVESLSDLENDDHAKDARNPSKRNSRIAAAGAVGAAGAALIERARSRSRARDGSREPSRSRIEKGLPIAAAGLGTAALAGLFEKTKAKKEAEKIQKEQKARARSRSGSRRDRPDSYSDSRGRSADSNWGVEYGHGDIAGNNYGPEYYGRGPQPEPFYDNSGAMVPAGRTRSRSRSLSRDRRGTRSLSRGGSAGPEAGVAAGALAASEHEKRKAEKRERKARKRAEESQGPEREASEDPYGAQQTPQPSWTPSPPNDPYANQQGFGSQYQSQFPPPPGSSMPPGMPNHFQPQYQPAPTPTPQPGGQDQYPPQHQYTPQPQFNQQSYPPPPPTPQQNMGPQQHGYHDQFYGGSPAPYGQPPYSHGPPDDNVSAGHPFPHYAPPTNDQRPLDGVSSSRSIGPTPVQPGPAPAIHIQPPTNASTPSLAIPQTYVPPAERPDTPVTGDDGNSRRVSFFPSTETSREQHFGDDRHHHSRTRDSDDASPDIRRQHRRQQESHRGYDASDDTDLSPNSERRASRHGSNRDQSYDRVGGVNSQRRHHTDRSLNQENNESSHRRSSENRKDRRASRSENPRDRVVSPTDSDATIDLPDRFDDKGRPKGDLAKDPLGGKIDDIMKGKGAAGRVFGNFMDGLFGPDGRGKKSGGDEGKSRRRPSHGQ